MAIALLLRLEHETRAFHAEADAIWHDVLRADVTVGRYMQLLVRLYGFEAPIEAALAYTPHIARLVDLRGRLRSGLIVSDLLALQLSAHQIAMLPQCAICPFNDAAEALGWIYVIERATALHDSVRRHVVGSMPQLEGATSYLAASDAGRWHGLARALERHASVAAIQGRVIAAARSAFHCALDWFHGREPMQARGA